MCPDLGGEVLRRGERAIHRGESQVGDLVQIPQRPEDRQPDLLARHLRLAGAAHGLLDLLCELGDRIRIDRATLAGPADPGDDLAPAERFGHPTALDDRQQRSFEGGEPARALRAGPAAADGLAVLDLAGVDDPGIRVTTERTPHAHTSRLQWSNWLLTAGAVEDAFVDDLLTTLWIALWTTRRFTART